MSFDKLRKQSKLGSLTDRLVKEVEKMKTSDEKLWELYAKKKNKQKKWA